MESQNLTTGASIESSFGVMENKPATYKAPLRRCAMCYAQLYPRTLKIAIAAKHTDSLPTKRGILVLCASCFRAYMLGMQPIKKGTPILQRGNPMGRSKLDYRRQMQSYKY
jgi:hypothetical protein